GDFAFYRAYVGPDGKPAPFSADNVPYAPKAFLEVSTDPVAEGDFAMLAGYPGRTYRHRSAAEFADQVQVVLPGRIELYGALIDTIEAAAKGDAEAGVRYASQLASLKNGLKRAQGELDGLRRSDAVAVKAQDEAAMLGWLDAQPGATATRADIDAARAVIGQSHATRERDTLLATMSSRTQLLRSALQLQRLAAERGKPDAQRERGYQQRDQALIEASLRQVQRRYWPAVEKAVLGELLARYYRLPADQRIAEVEAVFGADPAQAGAALDALYAGTTLGEEAERLRLLAAAPADVAASADPLMQAAARLLPAELRIEDADKAQAGELLRLRPAYM